MITFLWLIIGIAVLLLLWLIGTYNSLVRGRNRVDEAWSDIEVQLKRRYDLIPNLIQTVQGYARHERELLIKVAEARVEAMRAHTVEEHGKAENMLTGALKSLFAVAEDYPDLKASENFAKLQDELSDTENKIQAARRFYNGNVRDYNTKLEQFPTNLVANGFRFKSREFFEIVEPKEKEPVKVRF